MSRKEKSIQEKVKHFFGKRETIPISFDKLRKELYCLSPENLKDINAESSIQQRLKCLKDLYDCVLTKRLEEYAFEMLCKSIEDMLDPQNSIETRHIVFQFYYALIIGQGEYMNTMRSYLFKLLVQHRIQDDTSPRLEMLKALTDSGKNIKYFEEEIGPFLFCWFPEIITSHNSADFLSLVSNVIKFNAAYVDENIISGLIERIYTLCVHTKLEDDIEECLNILEAILLYSHIPDSALQSFIYSLCLTVNIEKFSQCSWKQMRNLLGTNVGHTCILSLCFILQEKNYQSQALLRGAIFFIGMALWGSNKVATLMHPPTAVIPSFLKALESKDSVIAYEIILSLQRLIKSGDALQSLCWDIIFDIVEIVLSYPEIQDNKELSALAKAVHDLISVAENNVSHSSYKRLFKIVEQCSHARSEQSVIKLLSYTVETMNPFRADFLSNLYKILEKYFRDEKRPAIQLETLKVINHARRDYGHIFEDDLIDQKILRYMVQLDSLPDVYVRKAAVEILIDIGHSCMGNWFVDILSHIQKVTKLMFDKLSSGTSTELDSFADVLTAVTGLIDIFKKKLFIMLSSQCLLIYSFLISHLQQHFLHISYFPEVITIRKSIFEFLLEFRANSRKQIGMNVGGKLEYSIYVSCDPSIVNKGNDSSPSSPSSPSWSTVLVSSLSYADVFSAIITCLKQEKDWTILDMIFRKLPKLLMNKALIVHGNCSISSLCSTLCGMVSDRNRNPPESLKNAPSRLTRTDIQGCIYPCVSVLASYHAHMESHIQRMLIRCLQSGLVSRSAKLCIDGLMLCALEMQNSMMKLLPDVLLRLSKISSTVGVAVSVLEFLSNLIRLHPLYISFVEDQYMSIFAIALPYTNPFKFNQYIVALAHHVIAMWFLKCRIPFRKDFAKFITKGLSSNIHLPREDKESSKSTDDSSQNSEEKTHKLSNSAIISLHRELMETGLDLMARFTFGMSSNIPKRSPVSEFLLENGQKSNWLVGNKIITITTSSCNTKSFKNGLCERCYNLCQEFNQKPDTYEKEPVSKKDQTFREQPSSYRFERKRHRSAIQRRNTTLSKEMLSDSTQTKDDIQVHFRRLRSLDSASRDDLQEGLSFLKENGNTQGHLCNCWCTHWAEVHIRRPTGNTSWMIKIQNQLSIPSSSPDVPLSLLTSMVLQGPWGQGPDSSLLFPMHEDLLESEAFEEEPSEEAVDILQCPKTDLPMRRTNSSPDINTLWTDFETDHGKRVDNTTSSKELPFEQSGGLDKEQNESAPGGKLVMRLDLSQSKADILNHDFILKGSEPHKKGSFRDRGHTISVMSPIHPKVAENSSNQVPDANRRNGMNPSFVFLQLYHNSLLGGFSFKPLLLAPTEANNRALNVLDHIPPYDTHKIGVVYVGPDQANHEVAILSNVYGSVRYISLLKSLGTMVRLTDVDPQTTYLGGLDTRGEDGKFALIWHDDVMQVVFHVATFMTNKDNDPNRNEKKKHIANDSVVIVYNESGEDYNMATIKGHVTNACVIITPEDFKSNIVSVKLKTKDLSDMFDHSVSYMVSDESLPVFVRQLALHANFASLIISRQQQSMNTHVSNWLERLRTIKRLRTKVTEELKNSNSDSFESSADSKYYDNFTDYV